MLKLVVCAFLLAVGVSAKPAKDQLMLEDLDDTAIVESTVREARAAPSHISDLIKPGVKDAFLYVYGDAEKDDGDVHGYSKKMNDKGQDGYKHYDSFHKKDGDKYGYEKHAEYGQENKAYIEDEVEKAIQESHAQAGGGKGGKGGKGEESQKLYSVLKEFESDDKKQGKKKAESEYDFFDDSGLEFGNYGEESSEGAKAEDGSVEDNGGSVETEEAEESAESYY
ncbi:hypothetical protein GWI33_018614 [Rhynchophorus ferrugineus]|uniref:Uncharacterized protein n=2 Tax=Rhynchophorus ferrugineus TaxID=354439 RepID=A0A834HWQ1_RHYFE|nr:hypothetical protein GWI33_018614 [Rhynchophorus ferrugineus]